MYQWLWPVAVTLALAVVSTLWLVSLSHRTRRRSRLVACVLGWCVLGVPVCLLLNHVADDTGIGAAEYADVTKVEDQRVRVTLPDTATAISLRWVNHQRSVRFTVERADLESWLSTYWRIHLPNPELRQAIPQPVFEKQPNWFDTAFAHLGWARPGSTLRFTGPQTGSGERFTVWFDEQTSTAYQSFIAW